MPTESLISLDAAADGDIAPYRHHRRTPSGSPNSAILALPPSSRRPPSQGVPIPLPRTASSSSHQYSSRTVSQDDNLSTSSSITHSPTSTDSPYTFSPINSASLNPASYLSNATNLTTPASSTSLHSNPPLPYPMQAPQLSYPSVPPPSLSSSLGSPIIPFHSPSVTSPDPLDLTSLNRRNSNTAHRRRGSSSARVVETGSLKDISENRNRSRQQSVERYSHPSPTNSLSNTGVPLVATPSRPIPIRAPDGGSREGTPVSRV